MSRGHNNKSSILIDTDDRAFARPDREQEPDREFNRARGLPTSNPVLFGVEERAGYRRALVPDLPGMVQTYERHGWKTVTTASANKADDHARGTNQLDSVVRVTLNHRNDADWHSAIVMEIPMEYWSEDLELELQAIARKEESFNPEKYRQKEIGGETYGHMKRERKFVR